jgi:hypothetical protein
MESTETIFLEMFVYRRFFWCYHFYSNNHEVFHMSDTQENDAFVLRDVELCCYAEYDYPGFRRY